MGVNAISTLKRAELIILCETASFNTKKEVVSLAKKLHVKILLSKVKLEDTVNKPNCKAIALTDKSLASAVMENLDDNYSEYRMEEYNG